MLSPSMRRDVRKQRRSDLLTRPRVRAFPLPMWPSSKNIRKGAGQCDESDSKVLRWYEDMTSALGHPGMNARRNKEPIDHNCVATVFDCT